MKFLIRDDDTCGFTRPQELEECYETFWKQVPINLSITPFRIPGRSTGVPKSLVGSEAVMPLEENTELIALLRQLYSERKVDFSLHGYHHTKPKGMPEYVSGTQLFEKTRHGKGYLQEVLGCSIETFVPPNNGIARAGFDAVTGNGMNLVNIPSLIRPKYRAVKPGNYVKYLKQKYYRVVHRADYPYVFNFSDHKEAGYMSITPTQTLHELKRRFNLCREMNGVFIFATHYHAFSSRLASGEYIKDVVHGFIEMACGMQDVEFISYRELWSVTRNYCPTDKLYLVIWG